MAEKVRSSHCQKRNNCCIGQEGPPGPPGPMGLVGPQGPPGPARGALGYLYVYNLSAQTVLLEDPIIFDSLGLNSGGFVFAPDSAGIILSEAGVYDYVFTVAGSQVNQFALALNDVPLADSIFPSGAGTQQTVGAGLFTAAAGDVLTLVNHSSTFNVGLASPIGGTQDSINASIKLIRIV